MRSFKPILSVLVLVMTIGASCGAVLADGNETVDPAALYQKKCSICHELERSSSKRKSAKGWRETVMRMKNNNGAPISDDEAEIIIRHLTDNYGKKTPF